MEDAVKKFLRETIEDSKNHQRRIEEINKHLGASDEKDDSGYYKDARISNGWNHTVAYLNILLRERNAVTIGDSK